METEIALNSVFGKKNSRLISYDPNPKAEVVPATTGGYPQSGMSFRIV